MKTIRYLSFVLFLLTGNSFAQEKPRSIRIQEIVLKDSVLIQQIEKLIQDEINNKEDKHEFFKRGLGYINLSLLNYTDKGVLRKYYISPKMVSLRKNDSDSKYPLFYSYVGNRLVLIDINAFENSMIYQITESSKRRFRKKLEPYLEKTQNITARDSSGNIKIRDKHFRADYFWMHSGRYIYIYQDKPPVILTEREEELKNYKN